MKAILLMLLIALCVISFNSVSLSDLNTGVRIEADGKPIDVEVGHLVPNVVDWNNDGKKDLINGQFSGGKIRLYLNQGTDSQPVFKNFTYLKAGNKEISLPAG